MKTLTRKNLSDLATVMLKISEREQRSYVGGGSGTYEDPYTTAEFDNMCANGTWNGGYVEGWGYTFPEVTSYEYYGGGNDYDPWGYYNPYNPWGYYGSSDDNNPWGYYGGDGYYYGSYPGQGIGDCVIQSISFMFGVTLDYVHAEMSAVIQSLYGYSDTVCDILAGQNATSEQVEMLMIKIGGSCNLNYYNADASMCALGLTNFGHAVVLEEYDVSMNTYRYTDPQKNYETGTISASNLVWIITAN